MQHCLMMSIMYTEVDEFVDFLTDIVNQNAFVIASGTLSEQLVFNIHEIPQLDTVYIYWNNQSCNW